MKKLLRKKNGEWFTIGRKGQKVLLAAALTGTAIGGGIYYNQHSDQLDQKQTQESKQQNNSEVSNDNTLPVTDNPITNNFESQVQPNENVKTDLPNIVSDENLNSTTRQAQAPVEETKPVKSVKHIAVKTVLPFKTITKFNPKLPQGTTNVIQEGKDGYKVDVYEVVSIADVEKDKTLLSTNIEKPMDKIVEIGTMKPEQPGKETPEKPTPEQPGKETPEKPTPEQPGTETPEKPTPEQPGKETPEKPTPEQPGTETPEKPTPEQPGTETPEKPGTDKPSEDIDWSNKAHFVINESEKKDLYDYYGSEEVNKVLTKLFGKTSGNITIEKYKEVMSNPELKKIFDEYQLDFVFKINDPALFNKEINDYAIKNEKEINKYFIELVNKARAKEGLKPVISASDVVFKGQKVDYFIQENANTRAKEMADYGSLRYKGLKSGAHKRPDGRSWYTVYEDQNRNISNLSDFRHSYAGENAAEIHHSDKVMISNPKQAIESIFAAWMASPGHRDLIMTKEDNLIFAFSYRQGLKDYLYPESNSKPTVGILHVSKWSNPLRYATNREKYEKFIKENPDSPYASKEYQDFLKDHLEKTK